MWVLEAFVRSAGAQTRQLAIVCSRAEIAVCCCLAARLFGILRFIKFGQLPPRKMITVDCGMNGLLSGFHFEFSEGGRWARSKYTCSKARIFAENRVKYGKIW